MLKFYSCPINTMLSSHKKNILFAVRERMTILQRWLHEKGMLIHQSNKDVDFGALMTLFSKRSLRTVQFNFILGASWFYGSGDLPGSIISYIKQSTKPLSVWVTDRWLINHWITHSINQSIKETINQSIMERITDKEKDRLKEQLTTTTTTTTLLVLIPRIKVYKNKF